MSGKSSRSSGHHQVNISLRHGRVSRVLRNTNTSDDWKGRKTSGIFTHTKCSETVICGTILHIRETWLTSPLAFCLFDYCKGLIIYPIGKCLHLTNQSHWIRILFFLVWFLCHCSHFDNNCKQGMLYYESFVRSSLTEDFNFTRESKSEPEVLSSF